MTMKSTPKGVLQVPASLFQTSGTTESGGANEITIVATNVRGEIVPIDQVPVKSVELLSVASTTVGSRLTELNGGEESTTPNDSTVVAGGASDGDWKEFTGLSEKESYDEAYKSAVTQAHRAFGGGDKAVEIEVLKVGGIRGSIQGLRNLEIKIRAKAK